jgi:hypothetical protein
VVLEEEVEVEYAEDIRVDAKKCAHNKCNGVEH